MGYATEAELTAYATARGITITGDPAALLLKAMDWLELKNWKGAKTNAFQDFEWPRSGVFIDGVEIDDETVPARIKNAQIEAAITYDQGGDPLANIEPRVTREAIAGAVSITYSDSGTKETIYRKLETMIAPYLAGAGSGFMLYR